MKPIPFPGQNMVYAEDQPEYLPLPVCRELDGTVTSCWFFSWRERVRVLFPGRIWLTQLTFNGPLQPVAMRVENPFEAGEEA